MMKTRWLILGLVALCVSAAPALADLAVVVDASQTKMDIIDKVSAQDLIGKVSALDADSDLTVRLQDTSTSANLDGVKLGGYTMDLTLHFLGAGDSYTATGTFLLQDRDPTVMWDLQAAFTSTSVALVDLAGFYRLEVQGNLSPLAPPSILGGTAPWSFEGDAQTGAANADGNPLTITVDNPADYTYGGLVALQYPVYGNFSSLENLFSSLCTDCGIENGSVHAQIVPVPAALLLGLLGMGVTGLKLRRYA